jgi:hypothetical protein
MLYQSILNLRISHVGKSHKIRNSAIVILLNKCDNTSEESSGSFQGLPGLAEE